MPIMAVAIVIFPLVLLQLVYTNQGESDANRVLNNILDGGILSVYIIFVLLVFGFFILNLILNNADLDHVKAASCVLVIFFLLSCLLVYIYRISHHPKVGLSQNNI